MIAYRHSASPVLTERRIKGNTRRSAKMQIRDMGYGGLALYLISRMNARSVPAGYGVKTFRL